MTDMDFADVDIVAAMDSLVPPATDDDDFFVQHDDALLHPEAAAPDVVSLTSKDYRLTGRPSTPLYLSCDPDTFSEFQGKSLHHCSLVFLLVTEKESKSID